MNGLTILIDMDGTIEDLLTAWIECLNNTHDLNVSLNDNIYYDMTKTFPSLTADQIFYPLYQDSFWETVKPMNGASETIEKMIHDGHNVYIVTASSPETIKIKLEKVLFKYFPYLSYENVIVAFNKQMIIGDVMIDDAPFNLIGGGYIKLLMDSPTNRDFVETEENGITRVYNWEQIYEIISSMCC